MTVDLNLCNKRNVRQWIRWAGDCCRSSCERKETQLPVTVGCGNRLDGSLGGGQRKETSHSGTSQLQSSSRCSRFKRKTNFWQQTQAMSSTALMLNENRNVVMLHLSCVRPPVGSRYSAFRLFPSPPLLQQGRLSIQG